MNITWFGHSCFLFENSQGTRILTDPFDVTVGYPVYKGTVDDVTISHHHFDHNYIEEVNITNKVIDQVGIYKEDDINIQGIHSYHDNCGGQKRGENIIFLYDIDGLRLCHLGDLGHMLTDETLDIIGNIDVLLIPVGGNYTLPVGEAAKVAKTINSKIVIPMHYKTPMLTFELGGVEDFVCSMKNTERINTNKIEVTKESVKGCNNLVKILTINN